MKNKRALWNLYNLAKVTTTRPSEILELQEYYIEKFNHDGYLARLSFDKAVTYFGNRIESFLMERDKNGKSVYKLQDLLEDEAENATVQEKMSTFDNIKGAFKVVKKKGGTK